MRFKMAAFLALAILLGIGVVLHDAEGPRGSAAERPAREMATAADEERMAEVDPRIQQLELELEELREQVRVLESERSVTPQNAGADIETWLRSALEEPFSELDALIAAAVARESARAAEFGRGKKREKGAKDVIAWVDGELDRWLESYDLSMDQVDELKALTRDVIDERMAAEDEGASPWELTRIDVAAQGEVRRIVGDDVYRQTERDRLTRDARGKLRWLSVAVGDLTKEQHAALDDVVDVSIERRVDDVVRMRSLPLSQEEYASIGADIKGDEVENWEHIRDEILTETQRRRIPGK